MRFVVIAARTAQPDAETSDPINTTWDGTKLLGSYEFIEPDGPAEGNLSQFKNIGGKKFVCRWEDKYGTGDLKMSFSPDFTLFAGSYAGDGSGGEGGSQWTGAR